MRTAVDVEHGAGAVGVRAIVARDRRSVRGRLAKRPAVVVAITVVVVVTVMADSVPVQHHGQSVFRRLDLVGMRRFRRHDAEVRQGERQDRTEEASRLHHPETVSGIGLPDGERPRSIRHSSRCPAEAQVRSPPEA
jgi:hypothetical protein